MKRFILLAVAVLSLGAVNEVAYGKPGNGKAKGRDKVEKSENQKSVDAHKNWGQLKKGLKDENGYKQAELERFFGLEEGALDGEDIDIFTDKLVKEAIKGERYMRKELRKADGNLPELPEDAVIASTGNLVEDWINYYLYEDAEQAKAILEGWTEDEESKEKVFSDKSIRKMHRAAEKFGVALEKIEEEEI